MTTDELIIKLRSRVAIVSAHITAKLNAKRPTQNEFLINHGATSALMAEQQFLTGLIAQLENEEVNE